MDPYRKHAREHRRGGGDIAGIVVEETDGSPSVKNVTKIIVSNGDATDNADGSVTINTGGAAGGAHALTDVNNTVSGRTAGDILVASTATTYAFAAVSGDATLASSGALTVAATHAGGTHAAAGSDHIADTTAAHAASAVANTPAGTVAATTVQAAIDELATDYASADSTHAGAADPHAGYRKESDALVVSHIIPFTPPLESAAVEVLMPRPGICVGEAGEHGTFTAIRGKAIAGTAGTGTNTILIEADDNPAFSTAVTLFTLALNTSTEVDDTTLDTAWASGDIFVRARMTAVGATAPKDVVVEFYFKEAVEIF